MNEENVPSVENTGNNNGGFSISDNPMPNNQVNLNLEQSTPMNNSINIGDGNPSLNQVNIESNNMTSVNPMMGETGAMNNAPLNQGNMGPVSTPSVNPVMNEANPMNNVPLNQGNVEPVSTPSINPVMNEANSMDNMPLNQSNMEPMNNPEINPALGGETPVNNAINMPSNGGNETPVNPNMMGVNPPMENSIPNQNGAVPPKNNKKGLKIGLIIGIIAIVAVGGFLVYYFFFASNPTDALKDAINDVYTDLSANLKKLENKTIDLDIFNDSLKINGDAKVSGSMLEGLKNDKINYELGLDYKNEKAELSAGLEENDKNILDASIYFTNNHYYLKSNSLINNTYDLGEFNFSDNFDLSELEDTLNDTKNLPKVEDIDNILKNLKDALISSLNKDDMSQTKEKLEINNISVNANKIVYTLNRDSIARLMMALTKAMANNDELLTKLSELIQTDKETIKKSLEEMQKEETYQDIEGTGTFVVYTTGITNKFAGFELNMDEEGKIAYYNANDNAYFVVDVIDDFKAEVTSVKTNDITDIRVLITEDGKKQEIAKITVRSLSMDNIDLDLEVNIPDVAKLNGTIKLTTNKVSDKEVSGNVGFNISVMQDDETNELGAELSYTLKIGEKIANIDTSSALTTDDMNMDDANKLKEKLEELQDTEIYQFIEDYIPADTITPNTGGTDVDIYDDDECWDAYFDQDEINSYQEYYDTYCSGNYVY